MLVKCQKNLVLSLTLSGYLLARSDVRSLIFSPTSAKDQAPSSTPSAPPPASSFPVQSGLVNSQTPSTTQPLPLPSPDLDAMVGQLQNTQSQLQAALIQLEQKNQAAGLSPSVPLATTAPVFGAKEDIPALLAEIEQFYQVMQPLMVQLETATRLGRPASELEAMRTQMKAIHERLDYLLARVEAAKVQANLSSGNEHEVNYAQWTTSEVWTDSPNQAADQLFQLTQKMTQLQSMLQQMQNQGTTPGSPVPPAGNTAPGKMGQ